MAAAPAPADETRRPVWFDDAGELLDTPVVARASLAIEASVDGPALIQEPDTVTVIAPGQRAWLEPHGNLLIDTGAAAR